MAIQKQTFLVTGATGGIGSEIVDILLKEGHVVLATGRDEKSLNNLKKEGYTCHTCSLDITKQGDIDKLINWVEETAPLIDWVIHVAGFIGPSKDKEDLQLTYEINTYAPIYLSNRLEAYISDKGGSLVVSSTAGIWGNGFFPYYSSSKAAINNFALSLAHKWRESAKRSLVLCPGPTNTLMRERIAGDSSEQQQPSFVAGIAVSMILKEDKYKSGSLVVVKDSNFYLLKQDLINL